MGSSLDKLGVMANKFSSEFADDKIGARLAIIRRMYGKSQKDFAMAAGMRPNRYSQYETGTKPLSIVAAIALCETYHLTLDYLYLGEMSGLRGKTIEAINLLKEHSDGV